MKEHTFECYLSDLQGKVENGGTGSLNLPGEDGAQFLNLSARGMPRERLYNLCF